MDTTPPDPFGPPTDPSAATSPPSSPPVPPGYAAAGATPAADDTAPTKPMHPAVEVAIFAALGVFLGLISGLLAFVVASSFGPTTTESGVLRSIEVEFDSSNSNSVDRTTEYVGGTTDGGREWRIATEEGYDFASDNGYPFDVEVTFSDWTNAPVGVSWAGFDYTQRTGAARVVWPLLFVVSVLGFALFLRSIRKARTRLITPVLFVLGYIPLGTWLGWIAMSAISN